MNNNLQKLSIILTDLTYVLIQSFLDSGSALNMAIAGKKLIAVSSMNVYVPENKLFIFPGQITLDLAKVADLHEFHRKCLMEVRHLTLVFDHKSFELETKKNKRIIKEYYEDFRKFFYSNFLYLKHIIYADNLPNFWKLPGFKSISVDPRLNNTSIEYPERIKSLDLVYLRLRNITNIINNISLYESITELKINYLYNYGDFSNSQILDKFPNLTKIILYDFYIDSTRLWKNDTNKIFPNRIKHLILHQCRDPSHSWGTVEGVPTRITPPCFAPFSNIENVTIFWNKTPSLFASNMYLYTVSQDIPNTFTYRFHAEHPNPKAQKYPYKTDMPDMTVPMNLPDNVTVIYRD
jgi:hypothetical protein